MKNISEKLSAFILVYYYTILIVVTTVYCMNKDKKCCIKTAQEVYKYEGWVTKE